jgi:hypothetical protein
MTKYNTPSGEPCPRVVRRDGTVQGSGDCAACGTCLQLPELAWSGRPNPSLPVTMPGRVTAAALETAKGDARNSR